MKRVLCALLVLGSVCAVATGQQRPKLRVGSKKFTESTILGEMVRILGERAGAEVTHRRALGNTLIVFSALRNGEIDVYPEYTGTLRQEILKDLGLRTDAELRDALRQMGIRMSPTLGFANSYGIAAREAWAEERGIRRISDLRQLQDVEILCSNEFLRRGDGFGALQRYYSLPVRARGMDHDLAYAGLARGDFPLIVVYTTEPEIKHYGLRVLEDDLRFFPAYDAVLLYRDAVAETPVMREVLRLCGRIRNEQMIELNLEAKPPIGSDLDRTPANVVADGFLAETFGFTRTEVAEGLWSRLWGYTIEQLLLVVTSMVLAIGIAVPLGILAARRAATGQALLATTGILQTLPSLALLVFLIPLLGLGAASAIVALFLYSLLPILRNTHAGFTGIPRELTESAQALGLTSRTQLLSVQLPLATPAILAGIKTAVVINIGTATLGAFIGAGGYGRPILDGISMNDYGLILEGAVPAALMALAAQGVFEWIERRVVSPGLRV